MKKTVNDKNTWPQDPFYLAKHVSMAYKVNIMILSQDLKS